MLKLKRTSDNLTNFILPGIFNERPTFAVIRLMPDIAMPSVATKIAKKIYIRCRLAEAQNWRCCWCGIDCVPESDKPNSATIEHVHPRSLGGVDHSVDEYPYENYAMACSDCNHRRGVISVEDMLAGNFPPPKPNKVARKKAKAVEKYIKKALHWNRHGWVRADGSPLCKDEWFNSLRLGQERHRQRVHEVVFGEMA